MAEHKVGSPTSFIVQHFMIFHCRLSPSDHENPNQDK